MVKKIDKKIVGYSVQDADAQAQAAAEAAAVEKKAKESMKKTPNALRS